MASIFLDTKDIQPKGEVYTKLYDALGDGYVPITIQELTQNGQENRIVMENKELGSKIIFLSQRIIFEKYSINFQESSIGTFNEFCDYITSLAEKLMVNFQLTGHRLSFIVKFLLKCSEEERVVAAKKLFNFPSPYTPENTFEWNWNMVNIVNKNFANLRENINCRTAISRIKAQLSKDGITEDLDALDIEIDFNTVQENQTLRFNAKEVKEFYKKAPSWYNEHHDSIINYIKSNNV